MTTHGRALVSACLLLLASACARNGAGLADNAIPPAPADAMRPQTNAVASIVITVPGPNETPHTDRRWGYISPGSKSLWFYGLGPGFTADLTPGSRGCRQQGAHVTCTFRHVPIALGSAFVTFMCLDQTLSPTRVRGKVLSWGQTNLKISHAGQDIVVFLNPILGKVFTSLSNPNPVSGAKVDLGFNVGKVLDPDGYPIPSPSVFYHAVGTIAQPTAINVSVNPLEDQQFFTFTLNGVKQAYGGASLASTRDTVKVYYNGRGIHQTHLSIQGASTVAIVPKPTFGNPIPVPATGAPYSVCQAVDGVVWFGEPAQHALGWIRAATVHQIPLPAGHTPGRMICVNADPEFADPVNFIDQAGEIGFVHPDKHVVEFKIPLANAGAYDIDNTGTPYYDAEFTENTAGRIGTMSQQGFYSDVRLPAGSHPAGILGGVFTDPGLNAIGYADQYHKIHELPLPSPSSNPGELTTTGPYWFTENGPRVGILQPTSYALVQLTTRASLASLTSGADNWVYAVDTHNQIETIDPLDKIGVIKNPVPGSHIVAIARGINYDVWILTIKGSTADVQELIY